MNYVQRLGSAVMAHASDYLSLANLARLSLAALALSVVLLTGDAAFAQADPTPIEQVFDEIDIPTILAAVVAASVSLMTIFIATRGVLYAKKLLAKFF
jgi:hypothetical protein